MTGLQPGPPPRGRVRVSPVAISCWTAALVVIVALFAPAAVLLAVLLGWAVGLITWTALRGG